jgi:pimeloyl-ACP methyl ester carboxylesterase
MVDHDTDAYYKIEGAFTDRQVGGDPHPRPHPRQRHDLLADRHRRLGFTTFPGEIWRTPRSWVEASYPNVVYFNEVDKGGHFAASEEPELFSNEMRAAFKSLR